MSTNTSLPELIADVREHLLYMQELGVELTSVDLVENVTSDESTVLDPVIAAASPPDEPVFEKYIPLELPKIEPATDPPASRATNGGTRSRISDLPSLSSRNKMPRRSTKNSTEESPTDAASTQASTDDAALLKKASTEPVGGSLFGEMAELPESDETIEQIRADVGDCTRCLLYAGRTQIVHSTGNLKARLMFVGEAPGADEDAQGFPFVGRAGQLLTKIIESIGYKREDVFIGNINRCRPPGNRQPTLQEAHTCRPFLQREIAIVRPKAIVVLGNTAMHNLLDTKVGITKLRGEFQDYMGIKVMPTFHPAFLLRDPRKKREVWEDMKKVRDYLKQDE